MRFLLVTFVLSLFLYLPIVPLVDGGMTVALVDAAGLVPCGEKGNPCNACHAMGMVNSLISYMFTIITFLAVMVIMYAGVKLVTSQGNASEWEEAKGMLTNMIVGFVIVLSAWLVVDTLMKMLIDTKVVPGMWNQLDTKSCDAPAQPKGGAQTAADGKPTSSGAPAGTGQLSDADARARLEKAGITVKVENTSLNNINVKTVDDAIALKNACNCDVRFTGGTESGHGAGTFSHGSGYKYDISDDNASLNSFITTNYKYSGVRGDGAALYTSPSGSVYAKEGNHWDVLVK
jgi:hypothetical protein